MTIPQGYKQTELGIIPENWEVKSFNEVLVLFPNNTFPRDSMNESYGKFKNIHYGDILIKYPTIVDVKNIPIPYLNNSVKVKTQKYIQSGDIIIADTAEDETVGKCIEVKNVTNEKIVAGLHTFFCRPLLDFWLGYLGYYINSSNYHNQLIPYITGIKVSSLSKSAIQETKILVPPLEEQKAIAEALSDIDELIVALDKKIEKKRLIKQGAMQELLTGKKRLPGFSDEWVNVQIKQLGKWSKGQPFSKDKINRDGKNPCIHYGELFSYGEVIETIKSNTDIKPYVKSSGKDVLFPASDVTPIGLGRCSALNIKNVLLGGDIIILELTKDCPAYISYMVNLNKQQIIDRVTGTTVKHINSNLLGEIRINISTDIEEQQAIATILSNMDKEIADLEVKRDKYRLIKSGMMQKLLTGQIRLVKQQTKIIPLGVEVSTVREIPVSAHIIAGHIVNRSYQSWGWGRTKLQKSLHLIGYCTQLNFGNEYIRNTAGPDDQQLMNYIDQKFRQYRHVNKVCEKLPNGKTHYSYTPTPMIQDVEMAYEKYPKELREQVDALIDKLNTMDLAGAEMLSTLYAVWNNRIIKQDQITDDLLIADFYAWSTHKADFEESRVRKALNYMRDNNIIPVGWGKYIDKR